MKELTAHVILSSEEHDLVEQALDHAEEHGQNITSLRELVQVKDAAFDATDGHLIQIQQALECLGETGIEVQETIAGLRLHREELLQPVDRRLKESTVTKYRTYVLIKPEDLEILKTAVEIEIEQGFDAAYLQERLPEPDLVPLGFHATDLDIVHFMHVLRSLSERGVKVKKTLDLLRKSREDLLRITLLKKAGIEE